jgi:hypothetical protein
MAHNYKAGGSGASDRLLSLTIEEASILMENNILVSSGWKLPHEWTISIGGLAVPPIPSEVSAMTVYIERHRRALPRDQRDHTDCAANRALWGPLFAEEWKNDVAEFDLSAPSHTGYNITGRRAWWHGCIVEDILRQHGYQPEFRR